MRLRFQFGNVVARAMLCAAVLCAAVVGTSIARAGEAPRASAPRTPGYLGVAFHDAANGHGAEIVMVDHDGPAGKAGLQPHDIVVSINGSAVDDAAALSRMIHGTGVGAQVALTILRGGRSMTVTTELADRHEVARNSWQDRWNADAPQPDVEAQSEFLAEPAPSRAPSRGQGFLENMLRFGPYTGLMVSAMAPQLAGYFGCENGKGLLVQAVEANSPAAIAGLRAGDVLVRADGTLLGSTSDWSRSLRAAKGHPMAIIVLREHHEMTLTLLPDAKKRSQMAWPEVGGATVAYSA